MFGCFDVLTPRKSFQRSAATTTNIMKFLSTVLALCALQADAFSGLPSSDSASSTRLYSSNWWDAGAGVYQKPSGAQPQAGSITRGPGAGRTIPSDAWKNFSPAGISRVEGQSRTTYDFRDTNQEDVQLALSSSTGRPVKSQIELWVGPDWTPFSLKAYTEDGEKRPIQCIMGTRGKVAQVEIRNIAPYEFALDSEAMYAPPPLSNLRKEIPETSQGVYVEGGSVKQIPIEGDIGAVSVLLSTGTRQLNAQIEILTGPNNPKQIFEVFTNNGLLNSLLVVFEIPPGHGTTVRITNQATLEFPCNAYIQAA